MSRCDLTLQVGPADQEASPGLGAPGWGCPGTGRKHRGFDCPSWDPLVPAPGTGNSSGRSALQPRFQGHGSEPLRDADNTQGRDVSPGPVCAPRPGSTVGLEHGSQEGRVSLGRWCTWTQRRSPVKFPEGSSMGPGRSDEASVHPCWTPVSKRLAPGMHHSLTGRVVARDPPGTIKQGALRHPLSQIKEIS